jgi:hypothetical protein
MADNGKGTAAQRAALTAQEAEQDGGKQWLHPNALTPRDYRRGKQALAGVLTEMGLEDCYELVTTDDMYAWCIWALKSRTNPNFTWDDALDTPFSEFTVGSERPPPTPPSGGGGRSATTPADDGSSKPPSAPAPARSSGPSST